jgi:hypothetical protein
MDRETADDIKEAFRHHVRVLGEELHTRLEAVADGQQRLERRMEDRFSGLESTMRREFDETRALVRLS